MERLTDPRLLANRAQWDEDARVRRAAVWRLRDEILLAKICESDPDESVRSAAAERLARRSSDGADREPDTGP